MKEVIAVGLAVGACFYWDFDAVGMLLLTETTTAFGCTISGLVVAGGSKASIKLFHDVLNMRSNAHLMRHEIRVSSALASVNSAAEDVEHATDPAKAAIAVKKAEKALVRARTAAVSSSSKSVAATCSEVEEVVKLVRSVAEKASTENAAGRE